MLRVALVGDSHLTDTSSRAVVKLGPRLRRLGYEVLTLARGGLDTRQALLDPPVLGADWAIYCFGTNDAAPWKQIPPDEFARNYASLLTGTVDTSKLVLGPPWRPCWPLPTSPIATLDRQALRERPRTPARRRERYSAGLDAASQAVRPSRGRRLRGSSASAAPAQRAPHAPKGCGLGNRR